MGKTPCCEKGNVKRGPWSPDEDHILQTYMNKQHGTAANWISLPKKAGLRRCGKSCRLRWLNYLRPDIRHGCFTEEEDTVIHSLYSQMGSRWSIIASQLHGRTDNDVKNHWNTKLKKKLLGPENNNNLNHYFPMSSNVNYGLNVTVPNVMHDPVLANLPHWDANYNQFKKSTQEVSSVSASSCVIEPSQNADDLMSYEFSNDFLGGFWSLGQGDQDLDSNVIGYNKSQGLLQSVIEPF